MKQVQAGAKQWTYNILKGDTKPPHILLMIISSNNGSHVLWKERQQLARGGMNTKQNVISPA